MSNKDHRITAKHKMAAAKMSRPALLPASNRISDTNRKKVIPAGILTINKDEPSRPASPAQMIDFVPRLNKDNMIKAVELITMNWLRLL